MHKINKLKIQSAVTIMFALLFAASVPAFAEQNSGSTSGTGDHPATTTTTTTTHKVEPPKVTTAQPKTDPTTKPKTEPATVKTTAETEAEASEPTGDSGPNELHQKGVEMAAAVEKEHKTPKSAADKQKICEDHKKGLTTKFNAIVTNSQRIQDKIDGVLAEAQAYQQANNLSPANYDSLLAAATSAQTTSNASIAVLKGLTPTLDCGSTTVGTDVATFKASAQQTRDNLKVYRTAVKAVLQALELGKTDKPATTGGSN